MSPGVEHAGPGPRRSEVTGLQSMSWSWSRRRAGWAAGLGVAAIAALSLPAALAGGVGESVEAFQGQDERGQRHALADHRGKVVVLVVWGSSCRSSEAYAQRLQGITRHAAARGAVVLGVAPNQDDSAGAVSQAKQRQGLTFPVLIDGGARIARTLGASVTPTACVVDGQGVLRYRGAIDDDPAGSRGDGATPFLREAIDAVLAGQDPPRKETRPAGRPIR